MRKRSWLLVGCLGVAGAAGAVAVVVVGAAVAVPWLLKDRVVAWVDRQLDQTLDADIALDGVSVSFFSTFPRLGVELTGLEVTGRGDFAGVPLARLPKASLGLDLMSVVKGETVRIETLSLTDPAFVIRIDEAGRWNTDLVKGGGGGGDTGGGSGEWSLKLDALDVTGLDLRYEDQRTGDRIVLDDLGLRSRGDFSQARVRLDTDATIGALSARWGGVTWLSDTRWAADLALELDQQTGALSFGENTVTVNALTVGFRGGLEPVGDDWRMDLGFDTRDTSFKSLLSLVPSAFSSGFDGVDAAGTLSLAGTARGLYRSEGDHLPAFDLAVKVADGRFQYPGLPTAVERIGLDVAITHPEGPTDGVVVDLKRFALTAAGQPVEGRLRLSTPISDPAVDAEIVGKVDLAALRASLPAEAGAPTATGRLDLDLRVSGKASDFTNQAFDRVTAAGRFRGQDLRYESEDLPVVVTFDQLDLELSPQQAKVAALALRYGDSDLKAIGQFDNLVPYWLADATLVGSLALESRKLDLRPFQTDEEAPAEAPPGEDEAVIVAIPTDLDFTLDTKIGQMRTDEFDLDDVRGRVTMRGGALRMEGMKASMLGGEVTFDGSYVAPTDEHADVDLTITGFELDLPKTLATFETFERIAPILKGANGRFDTGLQMATRIKRDGTPDLSILSSKGVFTPAGLTLQPKALADASAQLKSKKYESLQVAGAKVAYAFENGRVRLDPVATKLGGAPATLKGSFGVLDRTLDLKLATKIPTAALAGTPLAAQLGGAVPKEADVELRFGGTWDAPKVTVALEGMAEVVDAVKEAAIDRAKEEAGKVVTDLVAEARKAGDALIAEAEKAAALVRSEAKVAADKVRSEAKKQGDKLVRDAKGNPLKEAAAKEASKALTREADEQAGKLEREAGRKADGLVAEARKQKEKLIADAEAKARSQLK